MAVPRFDRFAFLHRLREFAKPVSVIAPRSLAKLSLQLVPHFDLSSSVVTIGEFAF
jgi:hypothetical protein